MKIPMKVNAFALGTIITSPLGMIWGAGRLWWTWQLIWLAVFLIGFKQFRERDISRG